MLDGGVSGLRAREKLPLVNGIQLAAGGLGALAATAPVEAALHVTDWRGVFQGLAGVTVLAAALIGTLVPRRQPADRGVDLRAQLRGLGGIFGSRAFWRIAPIAIVSQATYLAVQGLWAGPWLRDVGGLERGEASVVLLLVAAAMTAGYLLLGVAAERLGRRGVPADVLSAAGMAVYAGVQAILAAGWTGALSAVWILYGFFGTSGVVCYAALTQAFPAHLAGRVNTALNLLVFVAAFAAQWGLGAIIGLWPPVRTGYDQAGYRVGFGVLLVLQIAGLVWYLLPRPVAGRMAPLRGRG